MESVSRWSEVTRSQKREREATREGEMVVHAWSKERTIGPSLPKEEATAASRSVASPTRPVIFPPAFTAAEMELLMLHPRVNAGARLLSGRITLKIKSVAAAIGTAASCKDRLGTAVALTVRAIAWERAQRGESHHIRGQTDPTAG